MPRASLYYKLLMVGISAAALLIAPPETKAASFSTCVFCVDGGTCQEPLMSQVCSLCTGGPNPVYCAYDSAPTCPWDEIALVCGTGRVE